MNESGRLASVNRAAKIRFLSFTQFPDDECEALDVELERLLACSVCFENHYLQRSWHADAFGILANVQTVDLRVVTDSLADTAWQPAELPDSWTFDHHVFSVSPVDTSPIFGPDSQDSDAVQWTHVHTGDPSRVARILRQVMLESSDPDTSASYFVTTLQSLDDVDFRAFESLLPENSVRTPLWLVSSGLPSARVQALTGSLDVGFTISAYSTSDGWQSNADLNALRARQNLMELAAAPGRNVERELLIERPDLRAVRTDEFLFVEKFEASDLCQQSRPHEYALYSKPSDVWNVNDVSAEFHEVVDRLKNDSV